MASLSGNKIKDTFGLLLKLASAQVSASEQVVEDGAGNSTALKLSNDTVETTGDFKISGTPASAATSDVTAVMLASTGVLVKRNLSTHPIGTASITANSPLSATGSTVELKDAGTLTDLPSGSVANNDLCLIWDESASAYKKISTQSLADYVGSKASVSPSIFIGRLQAATVLATGDTHLAMAEIHGQQATGSTSAATSCVAFGTASSDINLVSITSPRDAFEVTGDGNYLVNVSLEMTATGNTDVTIKIENATTPSVEITGYRGLKSGTYTASFQKAVYASEGDQLTVDLSETSAGTTTVTKNSTITITKLG